MIENIRTLNELDQIKEDNNLFLLYFGMDTWSVCGGVFPQLKALAEEYSIKLIDIDMSRSKEIPGQLGVFIVPTKLLIYKGEEKLRESKFIGFDNIRKNIDYILEMEKLDLS